MHFLITEMLNHYVRVRLEKWLGCQHCNIDTIDSITKNCYANTRMRLSVLTPPQTQFFRELHAPGYALNSLSHSRKEILFKKMTEFDHWSTNIALKNPNL